MSQASLATIATDETLVLDTIATYLQALHKADNGLFYEAFAETAHVMHCSIADEKMTILTLPAFLDVVDGLHKEHGYVEEFHSNPIVSVSGPVASVLVPFVLKLGSAEVLGTDVFSLARSSGKWTIVNKLYSA